MPSTNSDTPTPAGPAAPIAAAVGCFLRPATRMAHTLADHPNLHPRRLRRPALTPITGGELATLDLPAAVIALLAAPRPGAVRTVRSRNGTTVTVVHATGWSLILRRRRAAADVCLFHTALPTPVLLRPVHGPQRRAWQELIGAVTAARHRGKDLR